MIGFRFGVFAQLAASFAIAIVFTIAAALVGIIALQKFNDGVDDLALSRLPAMTLAYQLGQQSETIVASAPMLVRAKTQAQRETISFRISDRMNWLGELISSLDQYVIDQNTLVVISQTREELLQNYDRLNNLVAERITLDKRKKDVYRQIRLLLNASRQSETGIHAQVSEQYYQMVEYLLLLETYDVESHQTLGEIDIKSTLNTVFNGNTKEDNEFATQLYDIAWGENGVFEIQKKAMDVSRKIDGILALNERLSSRFVYSINDLIREMRNEIQESSLFFKDLVEEQTSILSAIVLTACIGMGAVGWFLVWRILSRLKRLKQSIRLHAQEGYVDENFQIEGADEISDMADAFRFLVREIDHREAEMRKSEARFRDVAEATSDWVWETDASLNYSLLSDRFFEITGFLRKDIIGLSFLDFAQSSPHVGEAAEKWLHHGNDLKNRRSFRDFTFSLKCPDNLNRQVKISGKPIFDDDGVFIGYRGTGSDITAETQARSRLTAANEIMPGAFALWDHENRLVLCNRKFYQLYKIINDRIRPGVTFEELTHLLVERRAIRDPEAYLERRKKFRQQPNGIFMEAMSNGRYLQVSESSTLDGGTVSLIIDMTDRIESEERLKQARLESENANKAKSKFLAAASHDLRQPLHAIGMFLSALHDRRIKFDDEEAVKDLKIINNISDSLDALRGLLNALLDISKLDAGVMKAELQPVDLHRLVERMVNQHSPRAHEKGLKLKSFCPDEIGVLSDPVLLERIISNLLSNAVRYTTSGGVFIGVRRRKDNVLIEVWDTGIGIPEDKVQDVFIEFQQLDNPGRDRRRGLGLGLAIVERLVSLMRHELKLDSKLGQGTRFVLRLKQSEVIRQEIEQQPVEVVLKGGDVPLIAIIDDEPDILSAMEELILGWKYKVISATRSDELLDKLSSLTEVPALILADYRLQETATGANVIDRVHEQLGQEIPAAIITGDTAPDRIQEAKASGYRLLHKPLRPAQLRQLIRSVQANAFS